MRTRKFTVEDYIRLGLEDIDYTFIKRNYWPAAKVLQMLDQRRIYTVRPPCALGGHTLFLVRDVAPAAPLAIRVSAYGAITVRTFGPGRCAQEATCN